CAAQDRRRRWSPHAARRGDSGSRRESAHRFGRRRGRGRRQIYSDMTVVEQFMPLFAPKTVAVIGASTKGGALPNIFIRRIREFGYEGAIYPIHPSAAEIDGLPAYKSLADTPEPIDYAYIAIAAAQIPPLLSSARGRLRFAQVISSGFGEVEEGRALQDELARAAREGGARLIGPNCLGIYTPRG